MKVRTVTEFDEIEVIKSQDFLSELSNIIFSICKTNELFRSENSPLNKVESRLDALNEKISKQDQLLTKANEMKKAFREKNRMLENENLDLRAKLLEQLGSEL